MSDKDAASLAYERLREKVLRLRPGVQHTRTTEPMCPNCGEQYHGGNWSKGAQCVCETCGVHFEVSAQEEICYYTTRRCEP